MIPTRNYPVTAIILAAGTSSRFVGDNKLLQLLDGTSIIEHTVARAAASQVGALIVVTGFQESEVSDCLRRHAVQSVFNEAYETGMASSIVCGVQAAPPDHHILIWPGDMPLVTSQTVSRVLQAEANTSIVTPIFKGRQGHPVFFGHSFRQELLQLEGDRGARTILDNHRTSVVNIEVDDPGVLMDVDTDEDLRDAARILGRS